MKLRTLCTIAVLMVALAVPFATAQEITVAAASDLQAAFQEVSSRFQKETGKSLKMTFGSSGNFFAQIQNGAPFDVFFSADIDLVSLCHGKDRPVDAKRIETRPEPWIERAD
jgi:molybdate transport system substrate-binding protein